VQHVTIYHRAGEYAGWPANYGIWSWDDEIVVGFTLGRHDPAGGFHARSREAPFVAMQARSRDGGQTWDVGPTPCRAPANRGLSADEHVAPGLRVGEALGGLEGLPACPGGTDFTHPDFALMCARSGLTAGARSWFYLSKDRCGHWEGPYGLPLFDQPGIAARTDYLVEGPRSCLLFLTAAKSDGKEGRVFCARTTDGGRSFEFVAWIGPEPEGFAIMPASVRLPDGRLLAALRCRGTDAGVTHDWIDLYVSSDRGTSWECIGTPVSATGRGGNPPTLTLLQDGRLLLVYGYRDAPFGIRARVSKDQGQTWEPEILLRTDGGCHDLGYPRTVQRPDGTVVTAYYYNDAPDTERYLAATLWRP